MIYDAHNMPLTSYMPTSGLVQDHKSMIVDRKYICWNEDRTQPAHLNIKKREAHPEVGIKAKAIEGVKCTSKV